MKIFVKNPRLFYKIVALLRDKGLSFQVPRGSRYNCREGELLIVDEEGQGRVRGNCNLLRLQVFDEESFFHSLVLSLMGKETYSSLIIGVDPGNSNAYVVIGDGELLEKGRLGDEELVERIAKITSIPHKSMVVRIGMAKGNEEKAMRIASLTIMRARCPVELVDEYRTSKRGVFLIDRDRDINAAYIIAMREGRKAKGRE